MEFRNDMLRWGGNHFSLEYTIEGLLREHSQLTLTKLKELLDESKTTYDESSLNESLYNLLVRYGKVVKDCFWNGEEIYHYIEPYYQDSSYTKNYYSFTVDDYQSKKFLLIADTHIGNPELENFKLLRKVYEKAIELEADKCFHLGDIFTGNYQDYSDDKIEKQIKSFIEKYPNPTKSEMMTYALLGNHDEWIRGSINHIWKYRSAYYYDFRCLSKYIPSFYTFQKERWQTNFQDIKAIFSHRLYISWILQNKNLNSLEELDKYLEWMDSEHQILISGHLHRGFIYSTDELEKENSKIFIGVPSTSSINIKGIVAYIISMNYDNSFPVSMEITPLKCDSNYMIYESDTFDWNFREKNKTYQKTFNLK